MWRAAVAGMWLLGLAVGGGAATPAPASTSASASATATAELVFSSTRAQDYHNEIYAIDAQTGRRRNLSRSPAADVEPALSPDGRWVAFASQREGSGFGIWLAPVRGGPARRLQAPAQEGINSLAWSPDGSALAAVRSSASAAGGPVFVVPRAGGQARRVGRGVAVHWLTPRVLVISGDGVTAHDRTGRVLWRHRGFAPVASSRGELALHDRSRILVLGADGRPRASVRSAGYPLWSPDGTRLAYALGVDAGIGLLERSRGGFRSRVLSRRTLHPRSWSPDGRRLLASSAGTYRPVILSLDGRTSAAGVEEGSWARSGSTIVGLGPRGLSVWRPGSRPRLLVAAGGGPCPLRWDGIQWVDGRLFVVQLGRDSQGEANLWTMSRSGQGLRPLVRTTAWESAPEWSPDRTRLVYESGHVHTHAASCDGPITPRLRIARADGSGDRMLTPPAGDGHFQLGPRWSPDGSKVAFHRTDLGELDEFGVFVVDVATRALRRLTTGYGEGVSWAPEGRRLAFSGRGVAVADLEAGTVTRIGPGSRAEWSPDGSAIAHVRGGDVWLVAPDGSGARRIADTNVVGDLRWAPDGRRLAFGSPDGLRVVDRTGQTLRTIRQPGASNPRFSRDGRLLAFVASGGDAGAASHGTELYVADISTGRATRLTRDRARVGAPSWR